MKVHTHGSALELMQLHSKYGKCFLSPHFQVRWGGDHCGVGSCSRPCCQELLLALKLRKKKKRVWEIPSRGGVAGTQPALGVPPGSPLLSHSLSPQRWLTALPGSRLCRPDPSYSQKVLPDV